MFRKRKAQQEMEEISRMLERVLNGECIPVSYTHLDVYKRQDMDTVAQNVPIFP